MKHEIIYNDIKDFAKDNKYTKWYLAILNNPDQSDYTEKHHWYPDCLGGTETIALSARQHYVVHWLLPKMANSKNVYFRMRAAFSRMHQKGRSKKRYINSRAFAVLREDMKDMGERLAVYHRGVAKSAEQKKKMSASMIGKHKGKKFINKCGVTKRVLPEEVQDYLDMGWQLGRDIPSHGCKWVHKGKDLKFVKKHEVQKYLSEGWSPGHGSRKGQGRQKQYHCLPDGVK